MRREIFLQPDLQEQWKKSNVSDVIVDNNGTNSDNFDTRRILNGPKHYSGVIEFYDDKELFMKLQENIPL